MTISEDRPLKRRRVRIKPPGRVLTAWLTAAGAVGSVVKIVVEIASLWM